MSDSVKLDNFKSYENYSQIFNVINNKVTGLGESQYDSLSQLNIDDKFIYQNSRFLYDTFYHNIWLVRRVVDLRPYQMGCSWGSFSSNDLHINDVNRINRYLNSLKRKYQHGQMLANKDGGSTVVRLIDDGQTDFSQPVNRDNIKSVRYSRVFDRWEVFPDPTSYYENPYNPEYYLTGINPEEKRKITNQQIIQLPENEYRGDVRSFYRIHRDRVLRFRGLYVNAYTLQRNQGWESSILPGFLSPLMRYLQAMGHVGESVASFEVVVFLIEGLLNGLNTDAGQAGLRAKFAANNQLMSSMRSLVADKNREDVKIVSRNYGGVSEILEQLRKEMMGASGLNAIELFQEHPAGLQATGQSERLDQALKIMQLCDYEWSDNLIGIDSEGILGDIDYCLLSKEAKINTIPEWEWNWNSSINLTPLEEAELREKYVAMDVNNVTNGIYSNKTARTRYESNGFNREVNLLDSDNDDIKNDAVEKFIPNDNKQLTDSDYDAIVKEMFKEIRS